MNPYAPKEETLCYRCAKACNGGCSWSDRLEPVPGWQVNEEPEMMSLTVNECPEFQEDNRREDRVEKFDNDGCVRLLAAVAEKMQEEYIRGAGEYGNRRKNREMTEKFLRSKRGMRLLMLSEPESVISMLRKKAMLHDRGDIGFPR